MKVDFLLRRLQLSRPSLCVSFVPFFFVLSFPDKQWPSPPSFCFLAEFYYPFCANFRTFSPRNKRVFWQGGKRKPILKSRHFRVCSFFPLFYRFRLKKRRKDGPKIRAQGNSMSPQIFQSVFLFFGWMVWEVLKITFGSLFFKFVRQRMSLVVLSLCCSRYLMKSGD